MKSAALKILSPIALPAIVATLGVLFSGAASAATIERTATPHCNVRLQGSIEPGDQARLKSALFGLDNASICLNSPGGSYSEGLKIVEHLLETKGGVGTVVDQGSECMSACALVFLAGHRKVGGHLHVNRKLHVSASLGFHGPYVKVSNPTYDHSIAAQAHMAGIKAISRLIELDKAELFPSSLLSLALTKGPDEYLVITDIFDAGAWDIDLIGFRRPAKLMPLMLQQACDNYEAWKIWDRAPPDEPNDMVNLRVKKEREVIFSRGRSRLTLKEYGDESAFSCSIDAFDGGARGVHIKITIISDAKELPRSDALQRIVERNEMWETTPFWYIFSPKATIKSLAQ